MKDFVIINKTLIPVDGIRSVDLSDIENLHLVLWVSGGFGTERKDLKGVDTINFLMEHCPRAIEGKRLRWIKHAWAIHNLIGHPLMQLLSFFGAYKLAMKVHDGTIPKPRGTK